MLEEHQIVKILEVGESPCHLWFSSVILIRPAAQYHLATELMYILEVSLLKISILLQYLRIFNSWIWAYTLLALSTCYGAAFLIATLASCKPFTYYFHRWQTEYSGTCIDMNSEIYALNVINIVLDGTITLLPTTQMQVSMASVPVAETVECFSNHLITVGNSK